MAQNLDNPFRSWDGQENISAANEKKAAALYRKTGADVVKIIESLSAEIAKNVDLDLIQDELRVDKNRMIEIFDEVKDF